MRRWALGERDDNIQFLFTDSLRHGMDSAHNAATIRAHQAVAAYRVVAVLPNDYLMIEFPPGVPSPPCLEL